LRKNLASKINNARGSFAIVKKAINKATG